MEQDDLRVSVAANFLGNSQRAKAVRFGQAGTAADKFDLNDYLVELQSGGARLSLGHASLAGNPLLGAAFANRGASGSYRWANGTELALRYGITELGDGQEMRATLTHGLTFAGGKGNLMIVADLYDRDPMYARDRHFSAEADNSYRAPAPWNVSTNTTFNLRSATTEFGNFSTGTVTNGVFTAARPAGVPSTLVASSGTFFIVPTATGVGFQTTTPARDGVTHDYYWNNNAYRVIQPQSTRGNLFASGSYELRPALTVFGEVMGYKARSETVREPDGITASTDGDIIVPTSNPFNPFGDRFWSPTGAPNADGSARLTGTPSAVRITNNHIYGNMTGISSDTLSAAGHPGFPADSSEIDWPRNCTARATGFRRAPWQVPHTASSSTSSTSGSAKVCSRPLLSSVCESSRALRCSRVKARPVPTQSGHQPCLLL